MVLNEDIYLIDQESAIAEVLDQHGMTNANGARPPIGDENNDIEENPVFFSFRTLPKNEPTIRNFQSLVRSMLWIARCTRPDISFAVHKAARRTYRPTLNEWKPAEKAGRYLKSTKSMNFEMKSMRRTQKVFQLQIGATPILLVIRRTVSPSLEEQLCCGFARSKP